MSCMGCLGSRPAPIECTQSYVMCQRPARPELPALSPDIHLCGPGNVDLLLQNTAALEDYIERLEGTLKCYEAQAQGKKP